MAEKQIVRCVTPCWDGTLCRDYVPGDQDAIDPERPIAQYFEGWTPGTKVYYKKPGNKKRGIDPEETFKVVPGKLEKPSKEEIAAENHTDERYGGEQAWDFMEENPKAKYSAEQRTILQDAAKKAGLELALYDTDFKLHKAIQDAYAKL